MRGGNKESAKSSEKDLTKEAQVVYNRLTDRQTDRPVFAAL